MAGTTIDYGYFPAPEGGTAIINGNSAGHGYLHKDWLGSGRIVSNITGHGATVDQAFSPYGEIYDQFGSSNSPYDMFASITDNFAPGVMWDTANRELSVVGRWLSPDPAGAGWNQYAYPTNPNSFIDPLGLQLIGPARCSSGPNDCPGGTISSDPLDPTGGGSIWGIAISGTMITTTYASYDYQWVSAGSADSSIFYGFDADGVAMLDGTIGSVQGGSWQLTGVTLTSFTTAVLPANNWGPLYSPTMFTPAGHGGRPGRPSAIISSIHPPTFAQAKGACTYYAIQTNNGFGNVSADSANASIAPGTKFQQYTQYARPSELNPSASSINALAPLAAPSIFIQASYEACMAAFGF